MKKPGKFKNSIQKWSERADIVDAAKTLAGADGESFLVVKAGPDLR